MAAVSGSGPNPDWMLTNPGLSTGSMIIGRSAEQMDMNDFFNLLAAQLSNQDMFNPQTNTEFIAQMAQFTALRGIQVIQEYQLSQYASSFVGKHVTVAHQSDNGLLVRTDGVVERVTFYDGEPRVVVDGTAFPLFSVMEVHDPEQSGFETGGGIRVPDINTAASFIGREVTMRFEEDDEEVTVRGVVLGATRDRNGNIMLQLDDGYDYNARYLVSVRKAVSGADDED